MKYLLKTFFITLFSTILITGISSCSKKPTQTLFPINKSENLLEVTPTIEIYSLNTIKPILDSYSKKDKLSLLLKVVDILIDPEIGIQTNKIDPSNYIIYDKLEKLKLGFLVTLKFSPKQKENIKSWRLKYMQDNPADVFFAPSANEIIKTRAAFGCSHYARSFIAVTKALNIIDKPDELRYVISCKADDYNKALDKTDDDMTINGHQFVLVKVNNKWLAINTSKSDFTEMPKGFSPNSLSSPENISLCFPSYPGITFLLRKIGVDFNDDCKDVSLRALMNIYRSGDPRDANFKWNRFKGIEG